MTICQRVAASRFDPPKSDKLNVPRRLRARAQIVRDNCRRHTD